MAILKCKMCGGDLSIEDGQKVCECEYCGSKQTLPNISDENIRALFNRANVLRMKSEFDKAADIYEKILQQSSTEAEAYWGLILCKYGVEYVEDPQTYKRVPTCHRTSFEAITADDDYKNALNYSDSAQKIVYESEAKEIDEIQKGILTISQNEDPYDIFICYKETDEKGKRTQDSVIANEIYYQLTQEGFKVFFAAITLEDKLGSEYEPYIFSALNSAKVMLVLGTKPEYFNAVWVKNEWSRFMKIMARDRSRILIPCYRDMDAYELPEEFAHLQAQDMTKIGFMQDLIRGIKKIVQTDESKSTTTETAKDAAGQGGGTVNIQPLLKRVFMFLEDEEWNSADEYCEKILDIDPENGEAYLGKLMAELEMPCKEDLKYNDTVFDNYNNYLKAYRFGDDNIRNLLDTATKTIIYNNAERIMETAKSEKDYKKAAELFKSIPEYVDAKENENKCRENAEIARKDSILAEGTQCANKNNESSLQRAIEILTAIEGWKNASEIIETCKKRIERILEDKDAALNRGIALKEEDTIDSLEKAIRQFESIVGWKNANVLAVEARNRISEIVIEEAEKTRKATAKRKKIICYATVIFIIVMGVLWIYVINPLQKYSLAIKYMEKGKYETAQSIFEELGDYKDSKDKVYLIAIKYMEKGRYETAQSIFEELGDYKDNKDEVYSFAIKCMEGGKYETAQKVFKELGDYDYKDSKDKVYSIAIKYMEEGKYETAQKVFEELVDYDYKDSKERYYLCIALAGEIEFGNYKWKVLAQNENKVLIITTKSVGKKEYNTQDISVTWENCTLRDWLNNEFYNEFSKDEQLAIETTYTEATDKIFLLGLDEAKKYFASNGERIMTGGDWWLRSLGQSENYAACVRSSGAIIESGDVVNYKYNNVRPALWLNLEQYFSIKSED